MARAGFNTTVEIWYRVFDTLTFTGVTLDARVVTFDWVSFVPDSMSFITAYITTGLHSFAVPLLSADDTTIRLFYGESDYLLDTATGVLYGVIMSDVVDKPGDVPYTRCWVYNAGTF